MASFRSHRIEPFTFVFPFLPFVSLFVCLFLPFYLHSPGVSQWQMPTAAAAPASPRDATVAATAPQDPKPSAQHPPVLAVPLGDDDEGKSDGAVGAAQPSPSTPEPSRESNQSSRTPPANPPPAKASPSPPATAAPPGKPRGFHPTKAQQQPLPVAQGSHDDAGNKKPGAMKLKPVQLNPNPPLTRDGRPARRLISPAFRPAPAAAGGAVTEA